MKAVNELKKYIVDWIKVKVPNIPVYTEEIPQEKQKTFPRIMFSMTNTDLNEAREDVYIRIEIHGNKTDTTQIDNICGTIVGNGAVIGATGLDHHLISTSTLKAHIYLTARDEELTNETYLRQRNITFNIKAYMI
jgi:hypothetical protein